MKATTSSSSPTHLRRHRASFLVLVLTFLLWPSVASADAGTAFMWRMGYLLLFGTAVLGAAEGILIGLVFGAEKVVAFCLMVVANYVSMVVGVMLLTPLRTVVFGTLMKDAPLYDMPRLHWIFLTISFVITLAVEWPFCLAILWRKRGRWWKSVAASGLAQTASYAVLVWLYLHISPLGLYREVDVDPDFVSSVSDEAVVYFFSDDDGDLCRIRLNGRGRERVEDAWATDRNAKLFPRLAEDGKHIDLWWLPGLRGQTENLLQEHAGVLPHPGSFDRSQAETWAFRWSAWGAPVLDLRSADEREWKVEVGQWGNRLIRAENTRISESVHLSFETPYLEWYARHATVLPGDKVVFELPGSGYQPFGALPKLPDQIVVLDLRARKLGLLTYGRSPVVVFPESDSRVPVVSAPD